MARLQWAVADLSTALGGLSAAAAVVAGRSTASGSAASRPGEPGPPFLSSHSGEGPSEAQEMEMSAVQKAGVVQTLLLLQSEFLFSVWNVLS